MISNIYWINEKEIGEKSLGTMARPRGNDWLEDEIKSLKIREVDYLVSLLESAEIWELGLEKEKTLCEEQGIQFINFPIKDINTPNNSNEFIRLAGELANRMQEGKKVVIHCRMGIGRSSMLAAAVMIKLGMKGEDVFDIISKYRKMQVPDTKEQREWVINIEEQLREEK